MNNRLEYSLENVFRILNDLSILTPEVREKVIERTQYEQAAYFMFAPQSFDYGLESLQKSNNLTDRNAYALIMYGNFHDKNFWCGVPNLIKLIELNISTEENRKLAVSYLDRSHYIPRLLKLLTKKGIVMSREDYSDLRKALYLIADNYEIDNTAYIYYKLENLLKKSKKLTFQSVLHFFKRLHIEHIMDFLPMHLKNQSNYQVLEENHKNLDSIGIFLRFLERRQNITREIITQEDFNKIIQGGSYLYRYVDEITYGTKENFNNYLKKAIDESILLQYLILKQGTRSRNSQFYKIPDVLLNLFPMFLMSFRDKKEITIFNKKISIFHKNWMQKHSAPSILKHNLISVENSTHTLQLDKDEDIDITDKEMTESAFGHNSHVAKALYGFRKK